MGQAAAHKNNKLILKAQNLILIYQNVSPDNVFLKRCIQQSRRHISLTKAAAVLSASTRNFFTTIAMHCNNMPL